MSDTEQQLRQLELEMSTLIAIRNERVQTGEEIIRLANRDFDRAAVLLGRQINVLRALLEATKPTPTPRQTRHSEPDPEWTLEEIAHYSELSKRESISKPR
jgi:hypothetical protein